MEGAEHNPAALFLCSHPVLTLGSENAAGRGHYNKNNDPLRLQ